MNTIALLLLMEGGFEKLKSPPEKEYPWYYLDKENKLFGPMSLSELKQSWTDGHLTSASYVWNEDMDYWKHLEDLPIIHPYVSGAHRYKP